MAFGVRFERRSKRFGLVPSGGRSARTLGVDVFLRGNGEDAFRRNVPIGEILLGEFDDVAALVRRFVIGNRVREQHRPAELGNAFVEFEFAIRELSREQAEHFAGMTGNHGVDVVGVGIAGIERRRVHQHELLWKFPRHEHENGRIRCLGGRPFERNLPPLPLSPRAKACSRSP